MNGAMNGAINGRTVLSGMLCGVLSFAVVACDDSETTDEREPSAAQLDRN